jgi:hypothetical protein
MCFQIICVLEGVRNSRSSSALSPHLSSRAPHKASTGTAAATDTLATGEQPALAVLRSHGREVLLVALVAAFWGCSYYSAFVWMAYFMSQSELIGRGGQQDARDIAWGLIFAANVCLVALLPLCGSIADGTAARQDRYVCRNVAKPSVLDRCGAISPRRRQGTAPHHTGWAAADDASGAARLLAHLSLHIGRRSGGGSAPAPAYRALRGRSTRLHGLAVPEESMFLGRGHRFVRQTCFACNTNSLVAHFSNIL